jgi:hypothetical protein
MTLQSRIQGAQLQSIICTVCLSDNTGPARCPHNQYRSSIQLLVILTGAVAGLTVAARAGVTRRQHMSSRMHTNTGAAPDTGHNYSTTALTVAALAGILRLVEAATPGQVLLVVGLQQMR